MPNGDSAERTASPTIYDVAKAAGVAASTVSRAFSRPGRVNAETAARIRQIAEEMGYRTNPMARALPTGRSSLLALVTSDVTNPFFFEIIRGAQMTAASAGYTLLVADARESAEAERQALDRALPLIDGLVLATSRMSDSAIRVAAKQRPTVVLNRIVSDVPSVVTDNARGMKHAVEHLAGLRHRQITYLAGPEASWADGARWRALQDAAHQLDLRPHRLGPFPPTLQGGRRAARILAERPTSAVIAYNDLMAIGLMQGVRRLGGRVPEDVSVVGFDDIFGADFCEPPLTTVAAPLRDLGAHAVQFLVAELRSRSVRPQRARAALLPAVLHVRGSTRELRRGEVSWPPRAGIASSAADPPHR